MDFYLTACLRFLIKLKKALQTLKQPEMNLSQCCTKSFFENNGTYIYYLLCARLEIKALQVAACVKNYFKSSE